MRSKPEKLPNMFPISRIPQRRVQKDVSLLVTGYYKPKVKDIKYGLATFLALGTVVLIFDIITKCDYMYFYDGHTFGVFKFIYENVPHFSIWTTIVVSCYIITAIATHFLVIGIAKLVEIIKEKRSS